MDYLTAYWKRKENNHNVLMSVAQKLKAEGCKVYSTEYKEPRDAREYIVVEKDGKRNFLGFMEVPYRWYIGSPYSGKTVGLVGEDTYGFPFTVDEILKSLVPTTKERDWFYVEI
ncbi:hypothetical protein POZ03_01290 [Bacteroides uniformis]|uniref:hypothetical protein n=1 Tax=Bacteroides uniformis TaxID=820 RepID=UPI00233E6528|nr:hypothetical protein [Bacteroides uniformis]MDC1809091.1 hypothetical protein [Bacteroides uniformis]